MTVLLIAARAAAPAATERRADIYSLGLVTYEIFCGQPAFSGESPVALVAKQVHETALAPR